MIRVEYPKLSRGRSLVVYPTIHQTAGPPRSKRVRSQIFDDRAITRLYYITRQFRKNFCLKDRATTDPPVRKLGSLPPQRREKLERHWLKIVYRRFDFTHFSSGEGH